MNNTENTANTTLTPNDVANLEAIARQTALPAAVEYDLEERGLVTTDDGPYALLTPAAFDALSQVPSDKFVGLLSDGATVTAQGPQREARERMSTRGRDVVAMRCMTRGEVVSYVASGELPTLQVLAPAETDVVADAIDGYAEIVFDSATDATHVDALRALASAARKLGLEDLAVTWEGKADVVADDLSVGDSV